MKILMLNNEFPPLGGGTGTVNREILHRLAKFPGVEIDLITSALGTREEEERYLERVHFYKVPVNNQNIHHSTMRELLRYAARALPTAMKLNARRNYDVCLAWSAVPAGGVALALRRLQGLRYIVRVCGPDIPGHERRYGWLYPLLTPILRAIWRGAERVIAKCEREADSIRAVDSRPRLTLIPNGVDTRAFQPGGALLDGGPRSGLHRGPLKMICVARLIEHKGQRYLIEAVRHLTDRGLDTTLDLVGTGDAEPEYRRLAESLGVAERVRFAGYVPREQIAARYAAAHVFVLPSFNEGMSVATLEAMASGLPVVVTRTGGTDELVDEGVNGFSYAWGDWPQMEQYLGHLSQNSEALHRMGAASRSKAEQFSWDAAAQHFWEAIQCAGS
jgi:glycosyltransferase involved in cell wall biosynthesis